MKPNNLDRTTLPSEGANSNRRITAAEVCTLCGGISSMTLHRWLHRPELAFPRPVYIGRRRYFREVEVLDWLEAQSTEFA